MEDIEIAGSTMNASALSLKSHQLKEPSTSESSLQKAPTTFADLPVEMQVKIWFHALPDAQVVGVIHSHAFGFRGTGYAQLGSRPKKTTGLLRTNKKSRAIYLQHYKALFRHTYAQPPFKMHSGLDMKLRAEQIYGEHPRMSLPMCFIDPVVDTLHISMADFAGLTLNEPDFISEVLLWPEAFWLNPELQFLAIRAEHFCDQYLGRDPLRNNVQLMYVNYGRILKVFPNLQ